MISYGLPSCTYPRECTLDSLQYLMMWLNTMRHLRPVQVYGRIWFKLYRPAIDMSRAPAVRPLVGTWVSPAKRRQSLLSPRIFRFLNEEHALDAPSAWDNSAVDKLWLYNLHYFDDLNAEGCAARSDWHRDLIGRWVSDNAPGKGTGWEPYPASLRIVNWIKWALAGNDLEPKWLHSMAVQARWLAKRLEVHLLGNHLFANAKALVFAGLFFQGSESVAWLEKGMAILAREVPEQILPDGGHCERSPMYHALAVEDMLDLINLAAASPEGIPEPWSSFVSSWSDTVGRMRIWLTAMCHPDGEIAFFNDAALGVAPSSAELDAYAGRLLLPPTPVPHDGVTNLADSGYIRVQRGTMVALLDVAPLATDYLVGHAHADTLSFELSLFGHRVLVNSGTSRYGVGTERSRQRGTAAHNTVVIDNEDSSEVWGGFRVARRAKPFGLAVQHNENGSRIVCSHDGYARLPGKPSHQRGWYFSDGSLEIVDVIEGEFREAVSRLFFSPGVELSQQNSGETGRAALDAGRIMAWSVEGAEARIEPATYHPEFGAVEPNSCLEMRFGGPVCTIRLRWTSDAYSVSH